MRQIWIPKFGPPEVLALKQAPDPEPGPGEVRIRVEASGVNFADIVGRLGFYPDLPPIPVVPGYEVSGRIDAAGADVDASWIGRDVLAMTRFGGYADVICVPLQQIFARPPDMSALEAAAIPASSTAITPANYNFRYKGSISSGDAAAYIFLISPKKKSQGLVKGELWLDGATGAVLRISGRLVKNPSIFVKRVDVTRNTALRDGVAEMQVTHLSVDVRFIGRAELTVQERPCVVADCGSAPAAGQ